MVMVCTASAVVEDAASVVVFDEVVVDDDDLAVLASFSVPLMSSRILQ